MKNKFFFITTLCSILINSSCGAMEQQPVRQNNQERSINVGALIVNNNREFLLGNCNGTWTMPSTEYKNEDASMSDAAQRCMLQHAGIQLEPSTHLFEIDKKDNTIRMFVIFNLITQQPQINSTAFTSWKWRPIEELRFGIPLQQKIYDILIQLPTETTSAQSSSSSRTTIEINNSQAVNAQSSSSSNSCKRKADEVDEDDEDDVTSFIRV